MTRLALQRPFAFLALTALVTGLLGWAASGVRIDNTPQAWLPTQDAELDVYREFREVFGEDAFVLVASDLLDLQDPAVRARFLAVQDELGGLQGVARVEGPLARGDLLSHAREALPRRLALLRAAASSDAAPADLLLLESEVCASQAFLFYDDDPERALPLYQQAEASAQRALAQLDPTLPAALSGLTSEAPPADLLAAQGDVAVPAAFWWAFARGAQARASGFGPQTLAALPRIDAVMRWVLEEDETFFHGGPHLYFAVREASLPRSLGGDPERCLPHFEALDRITDRHDLLARVLYAQLYAPTLAATPAGTPLPLVLEAQRRAWDAYRLPLREVLAAPPSLDVGDPLANAEARRRAAALLADPEDHGVIVPQGMQVAAPPAPLPPPAWRDDPLGRLLVGRQGQRLGLVVVPDPALTPLERNALVDRIRAHLIPHEGQLGFFRLAGPDVITHDLDQGSQSSFAGLFPVVVVVMGLVLYGALGSLRVVAAILLSAGLAAVWTVGLLALCGRSLNMIVVVVPAILAVVTTAYALHLVARFQHLPPPAAAPDLDQRRALWAEAAAHTWRPCALTAITTALGLLSLVLSRIPPVRDLGLFAALGVLIGFALTFSLVPVLLSLSRAVRPRPAPQRWWTRERARAAVAELAGKAPWIVLAAVGLGLLSVLGISLLRVESHILRFFPASHRLPQAYAEIEASLPGLTPLEVWLEGEPGRLLSGESVGALDAFLAQATREPLVTNVVSPLAGPPGRRLSAAARGALVRALFLPGFEPELRAAARGVQRRDQDLHLRLTLTCRTTSSDAFHDLVRRLRDAARGAFPQGVRVRLTGAVPLLVRVQVLLVQTQLRSFAMALLLITVVLALHFRDPKLVLVSLLPNVLPIAGTLGLMGFLGIPLNTATVTVAGIALGLVVDDTIHLLHEYALRRGTSPDPAGPIAETLLVVGRPILTTSLAVALGFGAFMLAPFRPTLYFGLLIAVTAVLALACDLLVLPALLLLGRPTARGAGAAATPQVGSPPQEPSP